MTIDLTEEEIYTILTALRDYTNVEIDEQPYQKLAELVEREQKVVAIMGELGLN